MSTVPAVNVVAKDIMVTKLVTLTPDMDALDAIKKLLHHRISGAPVVDAEGNYLGVFSEKTSMSFLIDLAYEQLPSNRVGAFMDTDQDRTIREDADLLTIAQIFLNTHYRRLPVVRDGKLVGQLSRRDVLRAALDLIGDPSQSQGSSVLYLSALVDRDDSPVR